MTTTNPLDPNYRVTSSDPAWLRAQINKYRYPTNPASKAYVEALYKRLEEVES